MIAKLARLEPLLAAVADRELAKGRALAARAARLQAEIATLEADVEKERRAAQDGGSALRAGFAAWQDWQARRRSELGAELARLRAAQSEQARRAARARARAELIARRLAEMRRERARIREARRLEEIALGPR